MSNRRDASTCDLSDTFRTELSPLYRYANTLLGDGGEAEDAVQDAFLRLVRHNRRPDEFVSARAYVFRVVRNVCLDRKRMRARQRQVFSDIAVVDDLQCEATDGTPETHILSAESFQGIADAMSALPEVEAEALSLVVVEGLSYQETADATDVPIGTVRSRLNRARRTLREGLQDQSTCQKPETPTATVIGFARKSR